MYTSYKADYPDDKISFSLFCALRPKYAVIAGTSGTHKVCVCEKHENAKLLPHARNRNISCNDLINLLICEKSDNYKCMVRLCSTCTDKEEFRKKIVDKIFSNFDLASDKNKEIFYKQWSKEGDRVQLISVTQTVEELIEKSVFIFNDSIYHHYVFKEQSRYLKDLKSNLNENTVIIMMDFAQNYTFVVQDEVQGHYWSRNCCTLHPVVIYFRKNGELKHESLCFITDDLKHDVSAVHVFVNHVIAYIKEKFPGKTEVKFFTDGCGGQYKCCTNFLFLCEFETLHGIKVEWIFLATSHGKSPCDATGGTVKRNAAKESLRRDKDKQILSTEELHKFCEESLPGIKTILIKKEEIDIQREITSKLAQTVPGTRSYHHFTPLTKTIVGCKSTSFQENYDIRFDLLSKDTDKWAENQFVSFIFGEEWFLGLIVEIFELEMSARIAVLQHCKKILTNGLICQRNLQYLSKKF